MQIHRRAGLTTGLITNNISSKPVVSISTRGHENGLRFCAVMATTLPWHPLLCPKPLRLHQARKTPVTRRAVGPVRAFGRSDFDSFAKRMATGEVWRDVLRSTNDGFEQLVYETRKTAERIDRRFSVSRRLSAVAQSASYRAREIDRDFEITRRLRTFSLDFSQNWPRVCAFSIFFFFCIYAYGYFHELLFVSELANVHPTNCGTNPSLSTSWGQLKVRAKPRMDT